jgi:acetyl-CoA carboxylase biotin carboxyl carrier protein
VSIDYQEIRELLKVVAQTNITELKLKSDDFELNVSQSLSQLPPRDVAEVTHIITPVTSSPPQSDTSPPSPSEKNWLPITSPMVGTFYRAPAPGESAYVEVNDRITRGQVVCIIEAMKLMNEIESEVTGQVMEIAVENGQPVEYGAILMWIKTD